MPDNKGTKKYIAVWANKEHRVKMNVLNLNESMWISLKNINFQVKNVEYKLQYQIFRKFTQRKIKTYLSLMTPISGKVPLGICG